MMSDDEIKEVVSGLSGRQLDLLDQSTRDRIHIHEHELGDRDALLVARLIEKVGFLAYRATPRGALVVAAVRGRVQEYDALAEVFPGRQIDAPTAGAIFGFLEGLASDGRTLTIRSLDGQTQLVLREHDTERESTITGASLVDCLTQVGRPKPPRAKA